MVCQANRAPPPRGLALCACYSASPRWWLVNPPASTTPLLNERFATYCVAIVAFALVIVIARKAQLTEVKHVDPPWSSLAAAAVLIVTR